MLQIVINNLENGKIESEDLEYILQLDDIESITFLYEKSQDTQRKLNENIKLETNIYYPDIYGVDDNCPTCGYRTPQSHKKYNPEYIKNIIDYNIRDISSYPIEAINCYGRCNSKIENFILVLKILSRYDLGINVKLENFDDYYEISNYNINSLIIDYTLTNHNPFIKRNHVNFNKKMSKLSKIIKDNSNIQIVCEFMINNYERHVDLKHTIDNLLKINPDVIEIIGYDPFYDTPEEYNPQYTQDYIKKIISILRIVFPKTKLKIKYATNKNNDIKNYLKLGINIISGVYFNKTNPSIYNVDEIINQI